MQVAGFGTIKFTRGDKSHIKFVSSEKDQPEITSSLADLYQGNVKLPELTVVYKFKEIPTNSAVLQYLLHRLRIFSSDVHAMVDRVVNVVVSKCALEMKEIWATENLPTQPIDIMKKKLKNFWQDTKRLFGEEALFLKKYPFSQIFHVGEFRWDLCVICQLDTNDEVKYPLKSLTLSGKDPLDPRTLESYEKLIEGLKKLERNDCQVPIKSTFTAETMRVNDACWHKACILEYSSSKIDKRIAKRKKEKQEDEKNEIPVRQPSKRQAMSSDVCIFCEKGGDLSQCSTFNKDKSLRIMAIELKDQKMQAKLAAGDAIAIEAKYHSLCSLQ